jgi:hypothetical protein
MISVQAQGGLGNLMFQIAFIETLGYHYRLDTAINGLLDNFNHLKTEYTRSPHADEYLNIFQGYDWTKNQDRLHELEHNKRVPFHYVNVMPEDGTNYIGYFQSDRYFDKTVAWEIFRPSYAIRSIVIDYSDIFSGITCSIHVRRGDYVQLQGHHPLQGMDYYTHAIATLRPFKIDKFLVFSDDIEWCKENFIGDKFIFINNYDYVELFLMAKCKHHITANSSFSWWGSWLGSGYDSVTICPERWLGPKCADDPSDIIPERWIKL